MQRKLRNRSTTIRPDVTISLHYENIVGNLSDGNIFVKNVINSIKEGFKITFQLPDMMSKSREYRITNYVKSF